MMPEITVVPKKWFPFFWNGASAITFGRYIFVEESIWNRLDGVRKNALLLHEREHMRQQCSENIVLYFLKYIFINSFRYSVELSAYIAQAKYLISMGFTRDAVITSCGRILAGKTYFGMVSFKRAVADLRNGIYGKDD